jgi:hypothetical protein
MGKKNRIDAYGFPKRFDCWRNRAMGFPRFLRAQPKDIKIAVVYPLPGALSVTGT